ACKTSFKFLLISLYLPADDECGFERICPYCFQFLVPDSCRVRLKPKMKVTPQIEKVLKQEAKNCKLNMKQTKLLRKYKESRSVLLVTCNSCNKTTRHYGRSRITKTHSSATPNSKSSLRTPDTKLQSANKVTPVSCSRLGSKGKSPSSFPRTPVSRKETTSSATKTPRNSKFHFSRLKQIIDLEEKEKSQKADLKTFLTFL
ncbi:CR021 protein, partial [Psilopogon haemacephalus]|nr:CR021 protein [Psilopogon haemacephalus]